jgi:hypothetical protein
MQNELKLPVITPSANHRVKQGEPVHNQSGSSLKLAGKGSPYQLPTDDQVFNYRAEEKDQEREQKKNVKNLKIWDKKTASTQNPLKNFKNFGHPPPKKVEATEVSKKSSSHGGGDRQDNTLITEAMGIVLDRKKQRENMKHYSRNKETMTEVVAQKKEIFLVTMTTKIIKEETEKLQRLIESKKQALHE